jgi:hypothetical protein
VPVEQIGGDQVGDAGDQATVEQHGSLAPAADLGCEAGRRRARSVAAVDEQASAFQDPALGNETGVGDGAEDQVDISQRRTKAARLLEIDLAKVVAPVGPTPRRMDGPASRAKRLYYHPTERSLSADHACLLLAPHLDRDPTIQMYG